MRRENEKDQALITEVKQKLDWYINDASDKEYDEKAVASLEYLLETLEPTDDFKVDEEKAWVEFKDYVAQREAHGGAKRDKTPKTKKHPAFWSRHKGLVAAALLVLILAVSIGTSSEAVRDNGFFHWIQDVVGGRKMVTSPDSLDEMTEQSKTTIYTDRESIPEEWQEWSELENSVMMNEEFKWERIETREHMGKTVIRSYYNYEQDMIIIGAVNYANETRQEREEFDRYDQYDVWTIEDQEFSVGCTQEEQRVVYSIEFIVDNYRYYITGSGNVLNVIKGLIVDYRNRIEINI